MVVGSDCLFVGNNNISSPGTTFQVFDPTWIEDRDPDNIYSVAGTSGITSSEAGVYLCVYGFKFVSTETARINLQARLTLSGTIQNVSFASGYLRDAINDDAYICGSAIIPLSASNPVRIEWRRGGDDIAGATVANQTFFQLVRLPDEAYGIYYDNTGGASLGGTSYNPLSIDTTLAQTDTNVIEANLGSNLINLKGIGGDRFFVIHCVSFDTTASRTQRVSATFFNSNVVPGTLSYTYMRDGNNPYGSTHVNCIVTKTSSSNEPLQIQTRRGAVNEAVGDGSAVTIAASSGIAVIKIPDNMDIVSFTDNTGGQNITSATDPTLLNIWSNVAQQDTGSFNKIDNNTIQVKKDSSYTFFANIKTLRTDMASNVKGQWRIVWRVNNTNIDEGADGNYSRGNQGGTGTFGGGFNPIVILDLSAGDIVELNVFVTGDSGATDTTTAFEVGGFAINNRPTTRDKFWHQPLPQPLF